MILPHEQNVTESYSFFSYGSSGAGKKEFSIYLFTALFVCKNKRVTYSHKH